MGFWVFLKESRIFFAADTAPGGWHPPGLPQSPPLLRLFPACVGDVAGFPAAQPSGPPEIYFPGKFRAAAEDS